MKHNFLHLLVAFFMASMVSGCASYGVIGNEPVGDQKPASEYSIRSHVAADDNSDLALMLSFSGGGTRAAALAYGVMLELRDTQIMANGEPARLLDQVDSISSVSGGSFTSAYYGLYGDGLFEDFEEVFLRYDIQGHLVRSTLNPLHWFSRKGRTERAIEYYEKKVFHNATYADMNQPGRPLIVINASDLSHGVRFSFIQEYFDLLCSDLSTFSVARAVTASSAVPVVFHPVVVENYPGCGDEHYQWLARMSEQAEADDDAELKFLADGLESFAEKDKRKYIHFVDGGITDNIGLRAIYDTVTISGGPGAYVSKLNRQPPRKLALIAVDASTEPVYEMDVTNKQPSLGQSIGAVTGVQLHRYNTATLELLGESLHEWSDTLAADGMEMKPYFIDLAFEDLDDPARLKYFNEVPTSFKLTDEQVDKLIEAGRELLRKNPEFQQFIADLK